MGQSQKHLYFRASDPDFRISMERPDRGIRSHVKCIKFFRESGELVYTNVPIRNSDELEVFTIKEFHDAVMDKLKDILDNPNNYPTEILKMYEFLEFYKKPKASKKVSKGS